MAAVSQLPRHHAAVTSQVEGAGSVRVLAGVRSRILGGPEETAYAAAMVVLLGAGVVGTLL
jgi:hypothetical protein